MLKSNIQCYQIQNALRAVLGRLVNFAGTKPYSTISVLSAFIYYKKILFETWFVASLINCKSKKDET